MMYGKLLMASAALIATPALAQTAAQAPTAGRPGSAAAPSAAAQAGAASATPDPVTGGQTPSARPGAATAPNAATATSGTAQVATGAKVVDTAGADVGTIESVANGNAVLSTGTVKVSVPATSFAQGPNALVLGMTKAQVEATVAQASAAPVEFTVGAVVSGPAGAKVGTVKEVADDGITVQSAGAVAKLPRNAFAKGPSGLVIGLTPAQFEAAAKAAGGTRPSGS